MLRTGVDIIEVARVKSAALRHGERFYQRFFTEAERAYCDGRYTALAARFAAKEAVAKALGTGIGDVRWVEIEITADARSKPEIRLHGAAARLAAELGLVQWSLSLSHTHEHAIAFVVAMG
ncbi:MAG: holo-ACP synthase [Anaerolineae bacterium]|nr:holo-ACP synthase [Anaerolineae bacterium]